MTASGSQPGHEFRGNQYKEVRPGFVPPKFQLSKPIKGPTGAMIVGYEWRSTMGMKWNAHKQEEVEAMVSDWDHAGESTGTGRQIVHVFHVTHPDGVTRPEGIRSAQNVLGISETKLMTIAKKEKALQQYRQQQRESEAKMWERVAHPTAIAAAQDYRKTNWSGMRSDEENNAIFYDTNLWTKGGKFIRRASRAAGDMKEFGWEQVEPDPAKQHLVSASNSTLLSCVRAERLARRVEAVRTASGGASVSKFGCLMAQLPSLDSELPNWAAENIKSGTLAEEGIETETHCTVLYGFNLDFDASKLQQEYGGITLKLGKVSRFECPEYDVLKLAVESPDLVALNERLMREFGNEVTPSKWSYNPHVTIAYVQKGTNKNLDGDKTFEGREIRVRQLLYSLPEKQGRVVIEASSTQQRNAVHAATDTLQTAHALVRDAGGLVLILKDSHYGTWDLPGGHLQRGETLLAGLSREVREETGLTPHVFHLSNRQQGAGDVYETTVAGHKPHVTLSSEHSEYRWVEQAKADLLAPYRLGGTALSQHRNAQAAAAAANRLAIHKAVTFAEGSVLHRQAATDAGKAAVAAGMLGLLAFGAFKAYQAASVALSTPEPAPRHFAPPDEEKPRGEPPSDAGGPPSEPVAEPEAEPAGTGADVDKEAEVFSDERREKLAGLATETVEELETARTAGVAAGDSESELSERLGKLAQKLENQTWSSAVNTEAQAAYGNAQLRMLARGGFKTKIWSQLERPTKRPSHEVNDKMGEKPLDFVYPNGQVYPGDDHGGPGECINCMCLLVGGSRE